MKVLIVGGGGREHALAWKLSQSPRLTGLFASPGSAAIAEVAQCVPLEGIGGLEAMADFAEKEGIGLTVVGPEAPLVEGIADLFASRGLPVFGPTAAAARLEGSKVFSKAFMERHGIPTAAHKAFDALEPALEYVKALDGPCVVKASGLAAGKGVILCEDADQAEAALRRIMEARAFGDAGAEVVVEEWLRGEEASFFAICDGKDFIAMPAAQDHKPVGDLDRGLNTGGMGAYCPTPLVTPEMEAMVIEQVVRPTLAGMAAEGHPYSGVLYVGLMIDNGAAKVLEYNCRFGDPECQPLMMMLESDLLDVLEAAAQGRIAECRPNWRGGAAACIVMTSEGYPGQYEKGWPIAGIEAADAMENCRVFHAGTERPGTGEKGDLNKSGGWAGDGVWTTNGGRVLGVTAWGHDLGAALKTGYQAVENISWPGAHYRKDIGLKGLKRMDDGRPKVNVGIVLGSVSDMDVAKKATAVLDALGVGYELAVASAHRTPERTRRFVAACAEAGAEVFIAIAGMAAALPGVVAAETQAPVIGVPVKSGAFEGLDALLSIAQMPPGIPVATVAVGGGANAALLAAQMLGLKYPGVAAAVTEYRLAQALKVEDAHREAGLSTLI